MKYRFTSILPAARRRHGMDVPDVRVLHAVAAVPPSNADQ
ncbi:MAG: hypothetical protein QOC80_671 [Frankiaceae bacterium]|nr:hypothetical protein [Frankiaceae bacterium]